MRTHFVVTASRYIEGGQNGPARNFDVPIKVLDNRFAAERFVNSLKLQQEEMRKDIKIAFPLDNDMKEDTAYIIHEVKDSLLR